MSALFAQPNINTTTIRQRPRERVKNRPAAWSLRDARDRDKRYRAVAPILGRRSSPPGARSIIVALFAFVEMFARLREIKAILMWSSSDVVYVMEFCLDGISEKNKKRMWNKGRGKVTRCAGKFGDNAAGSGKMSGCRRFSTRGFCIFSGIIKKECD